MYDHRNIEILKGKHITKNPDCNLQEGSPSCLMITWTEATLPKSKYTLFNTPCQHCPWWDEYAGEDD